MTDEINKLNKTKVTRLSKNEKKTTQYTDIDRELAIIIDNLTLFDDDLMSSVFDGNIEATELLLKIILERDDIKVISVVGQKEMKNPFKNGRKIRLDIYAVDGSGKFYNIEVQRDNAGANPRRARFHSSMVDTRMLKKKDKFKNLRESYVIFITENDIMKQGLPVYHVERIVSETGESFNDGSHILYVNGSYKGDDAIGKLIHDFSCKNSQDIYYSELAEGVKYFKEEEEGREIMCKAFEELAEKRAELKAQEVAKEIKEQVTQQVSREKSEKLALKMIKSGKYRLEEIIDLSELSEERVKELCNI